MILDQVNSLRQEREQQDAELQKSQAKTHEAMTLATEEASKLKTAKDVIKSLTAQVRFLIESFFNIINPRAGVSTIFFSYLSCTI